MKKRYLWKAALMLVFFVAVFFIWQMRSQNFMQSVVGVVEQEAAKNLEVEVKIGDIHIESLNSLAISEIEVYDKAGLPLLQADSARIHFSPLACWQGESVLKGVDEIIVQKLHLSLAQRKDGSWNYQDVLPEKAKEKSDFSGKIRIESGDLKAFLQGRELQFTDLSGLVDFDQYPSLQIKAALRHKEAELKLSGMLGGENTALSIEGKNIDLIDWIDFVPPERLQGALVQQGILARVQGTILTEGSGDPKFSGQAELKDGTVVLQGKTASDINALLLFNEQQVTLFSHALIEGEPLAVHGKIHIDTESPFFELIAESEAFAPEKVLDDIPYRGAVAFTANVKGTLDTPEVEGVFQVKTGEAYGYAFQNARAKARFSRNMVFVDSLTADALGGQVEVQGQLDGESLAYNWSVRAVNADAGELSAFLPGLSGRITADLGIRGQGTNVAQAAVYGQAVLQDGSYQGVDIKTVQASFSRQGDWLTIDQLSGTMAGGGEFSAEGMLSGEDVSLAFRAAGVDLSVLQAFSPQLEASGRADIDGRIRGRMEDPEVRVDFSAAEGRLFGQPYHSLRGSGAGSLHGIYLHDFQMENGGRITHQASGIIGLTGSKALDLKIQTKGARMEDLKGLLVPDQPITGNVDNELHLTGTLDDIEADGHIHFYEGSYRGILLTGADGYYQRRAGLTTLRDFYIQSPLIRLQLNGTLDADEQIQLSVTANEIQLEKIDAHFPYPVSGMASFTGKVDGSLSLPRFSGSLQAPELEFNGQKVKDINGRIIYSASILRLDQFTFRQNGGKFSLSGQVDLSSEAVDGRMEVKDADVNAMLAIANYKNDIITGHLDGTIDLGGTLFNPAAHVQGFIGSGTLKGYPLSNIMLDMNLQNRVITINKFYGEQGLGRVAAAGTIALDGDMDARLSAQDIDAGLLTHLMDINADMKGVLNVDAQFSGRLQNPETDVSIAVENGGIGTATFDSLTALLNLKNGIVNVNQVLMKKGPYKASAYGVVPLKALQSKPWEMPDDNEQIRLQVSLDQADLNILPMLSKEVDWAMGPLNGGIMISGTMAHPFINGSVRTTGGAVKFKMLRNPVQDIRLDIDFKNDKMTVKECTGKMGNGTYALSGSSLITGGGLAMYDFSLDLDKLGVDCDFYQGPVSGQFTLTTGEFFKRQLPKLAGTLKVENATIMIPSLPDSETELPDMLIDLGLELGDKVRLYSPFLYDLNLKGSAHFGRTTRHPQPSGEIVVTRGTVSYLKTVFTVREGSAYFNQVDSFLPAVHLSADTKLDRTKVYLLVDGPADAMAMKLASDSDMSANEILQLLTLRSSYQKNTSASEDSSQLADLLNVSLRMSFLSEIDSIVRNSLNVDEFNIVRDTLSSTDEKGSKKNSEVYNVEVGKYLSDKFMLKYTQGIGYDKSKVGMQYDFNDRFSLTGSLSNDQEYIVGVEARIKF